MNLWSLAGVELTDEVAVGRRLVSVRRRSVMLMKAEPPVAERWREAEDAALQEGFESAKTWKAIAKGFPGRTKKAVAARGLKRLGVRHRDGDAAD
jgi:hypothetical protein